MHIILTHEQADFDAVASLLGACLVNEDTIPVLPNRVNRNVRAFINLYGVEFPFVDRRDLPAEAVETVTLVDTQSLVSIKGMSSDTAVHVIDHHPQRTDLPPRWTMNNVETGANTTLFVEALRDTNDVINVIHATLLLLGIYEDTGSLTYARTTARDLRAAAYLLEQGASLRIAVDFLNHPLSQRQQELYDLLRIQARTHEIHGHMVIVSCVNAGEMDEEYSTVAHKLRDLLDPDALIVLIAARGGVQLIARSTSENIDVAELAMHFGGGGHARASAALIKDRPLEEVCTEVEQILPGFVQPAITVAQIMSRGPQVLTPDTPVEEAAQRMQRYGYEGYPIVDRGKVTGLLTRRAVDRAIAHKLNLSAASLMQAGEVFVKPEDSIESLQRVMTETGWGQVPVVLPETGQVIGIVTRTDLLKTLTLGAVMSGRQNLAARLEAVLPPVHLALIKAIASVAHEMHAALYIVGGFVRDLLLERPSLDFDLVVEGDAIALGSQLSRQYGGRITSHARFGTAKWYLEPQAFGGSTQLPATHPQSLPTFIDLISARTEFYTHPTALPTVERGSIKLDLHRRDFTINTLALRLDGHHYGELHDYWGGFQDIKQGLVRCLHSLSFVDDPTRMLRAVRFEQRFGFTIEERTRQLLHEALSLLDRVSGDRIRHELDHIIDEDRAADMLARLDQLSLLTAIHPALYWDDWLYQRIDGLFRKEDSLDWGVWFSGEREPGRMLKESDPHPVEEQKPESSQATRSSNVSSRRRILVYSILLIRLPPERAKEVLRRLKASRALTEIVMTACVLKGELASLISYPPSRVAARLDGVPPLALAAVFKSTEDAQLREILSNYMTRWRNFTPTITGHDLRARGLSPGPQFRQILDRLRAAWLDGEIQSADEENSLLEILTREK